MFEKLVRIALFPALLVYDILRPLPDNTKDKWSIQESAASFKAVQTVCDTMDKLGFVSQVKCIRKGLQLLPNPSISRSGIEVERISIKNVNVIITIPVRAHKPYPALVYIHGGGFVFSNAEAYMHVTSELTKRLQVAVFSIDYRLAPEYPFPAAFEDCVAVTSYLLQNADKFDVNPSKISVIGDSAGGNLAAAVALKLRDQKFLPSLKSQILIYPFLQAFDFLLPSYLQNSIILTPELVASFVLSYIDEDESLVPALITNSHISPALKKSKFATYVDKTFLPRKFTEVNFVKPKNYFGSTPIPARLMHKIVNPFTFPLMADNLKGLPPALVVICEHDVLRDEGILYANRLKEDEVNVYSHMVKGGIHGFFSFPERSKMEIETMNVIVNYVRSHL